MKRLGSCETSSRVELETRIELTLEYLKRMHATGQVKNEVFIGLRRLLGDLSPD